MAQESALSPAISPEQPELSNSQKKRIRAQIFNIAQTQTTHIDCPSCKKGIWIKNNASTYMKKQRMTKCPHCGKSILLTLQAK